MDDSRSDRQRIILLFAHRQPTYAPSDVLQLLGITHEELQTAITNGVISEQHNDQGAKVIPWDDVAGLALERWTPRMIQAALHTESDPGIPLLNQHRLIQVSLPIYLIRFLDYRARQESANRLPRNASDILEHILHDVANTQDTAAIDAEVAGYAQALTYPYFVPRRTGILWLRCRYCGIAISEAVREVCRTCERRHEPKEQLGEYGIPELEEHHDPQPPPATARTQGNRHNKRPPRRRTNRRRN
jgi:hypothetical protein